MIEIHTLYISNLSNSTGGHSTMVVVRRPPHYRDIILLPIIEIHILYVINCYNSRGGHSTMDMLKRPLHY